MKMVQFLLDYIEYIIGIISTFVIETDGSISDIKVLKDVGYGSREEIIRSLKKSEKWIPAALNWQTVRCHYQLPIRIDTR